MGLFTNLFAPKVGEKPSGKKETLLLTGGLRFDLEVAEVEQYQRILEAIGGQRVAKGINRFETAQLILEDRNPRDPNTVRVLIRGKQVGCLRPEDALRYRQQLIVKGLPNADGQCQAAVRGGWISSDGRTGDYEVWLDLPVE